MSDDVSIEEEVVEEFDIDNFSENKKSENEDTNPVPANTNVPLSKLSDLPPFPLQKHNEFKPIWDNEPKTTVAASNNIVHESESGAQDQVLNTSVSVREIKKVPAVIPNKKLTRIYSSIVLSKNRTVHTPNFVIYYTKESKNYKKSRIRA